MKRNLAVLVGLVAIVASLISSPAQARHKRPPAAKFVSGDTVQWGRLGTYCWSYSEGNEGTGQCADALPSWPRGKAARSGARARIRFRTPVCPDQAQLTWWEDVDDDDFPVGQATQIDVTKRRVRRDGETVACRVRFGLPDHRGHAYLELFTKWNRSFTYDHGTTDGGDALHSFHLRLS